MKPNPLALTLRGYAQSAPALWRPHLAAAADVVVDYQRLYRDMDKMRHDIERHVAIAADLATEVERLRAERDAALTRTAVLEAITAQPDIAAAWQRLGARAERDAWRERALAGEDAP